VWQVLGKAAHELDADAVAALRARYPRLVLDIGTGDGKHVLAEARRRPDAVVVGLDADAERMRAASARAAAKPARGGVPNAVFVRAAVEALPLELTAIDEVHVLMPWGSLLRALVRPEHDVLAAVAARCVSGASFLVTLNLHAWRPPVPEVGETPEPTPDSVRDVLGGAYADAGWRIDDARYLSDDDIAALATSWTKRLASSRAALAVLSLTGHFDADRAGGTEGQPRGNWRQYS
jgi:16S rRNA (adenine(1408)-N(1))-methyltransferase